MRVRIFQINPDRDRMHVKFTGLKVLERFRGSSNLDSTIYDEVYSGDIKANNLEEAFTFLNADALPPTYRGHSLSISDIVEVIDSPEEKEGFYFCDIAGFCRVDFDTNKTWKSDNLLRIVMIEPGMPAYETEIENSLEAMQEAVGGSIEFTHPFDEKVAVVGNDEAKLIGMEGNRKIGTSVYAGPIYITSFDDEGNCVSLTDEQIGQYTDLFRVPEQITPEEVESDSYIRIYSFG